MKIKHVLQGRLFGIPLHPLLIHFPIAAFIMSFVMDVVALGTHLRWAEQASFMLIQIGIFTGVFAALFGLADLQSIRSDARARMIAGEHAYLNGVVLCIYGFELILRIIESRQVSGVAFFFSLVALAVLAYSGYLGGGSWCMTTAWQSAGTAGPLTSRNTQSTLLEPAANSLTCWLPMNCVPDTASAYVYQVQSWCLCARRASSSLSRNSVPIDTDRFRKAPTKIARSSAHGTNPCSICGPAK